MDDFTADTFAVRDDTIPLLTITDDDLDLYSSDEVEASGKRAKLRKAISGTRLKEKIQSVYDGKVQSSPAERQSLQDRLFTKLLSQIVPLEDLNDTEDEKAHRQQTSFKYVRRPAFSIPVMTNNFRKFNARIGIVFVFQNKMLRLFSWRKATHTLSFMAVYTFICIDPFLFTALPLAIVLLFVMVPAFKARHPPPPPPPSTIGLHISSSSQSNPISAYSYSGPPLAPPSTIKPAPETSKDFFRNMRDLQNSMSDFTAVHDSLVNAIAPATNFSDEVLSSTIFLYLTILMTLLFIAAHLIPFRLIMLIGGQTAIISGHPRVQLWLLKQQKRAEKTIAVSASTDKPKIYGIPIHPTVHSLISSISRITLTSRPETREVEIFELQHRPILSLAESQTKSSIREWKPFLFVPSPFDPLSPSRIAGDRPKGARFFEDVQPPSGWEWGGKKWELDLEAGEWVDERLIVGVGYDALDRNHDDDNSSPPTPVSGPEHELESFDAKRDRKQSVNLDFGGWVWDLPPALGTSGNRDEDVWLAYGDYDIPSLIDEKERKKEDKEKNKHKKNVSGGGGGNVGAAGRDWEEHVMFGNKGRTGEWRRRRWVRVVKRQSFGVEETK